MSAFIEVTLISLALAFVLSLLYRFLTKPGEMRRIKKEMKFYQDKSKEAQKAGDTAKANEYMKDMMKASQQQFKQNMKPMMASMLIFFIFLGWIQGAYAGVIVDLNANPDATFNYAGAERRIYYEKVTGEGEDWTIRAGIDLNGDGQFSQDEIFDENAIFPHEGAYWKVNPVIEGTDKKENAARFELLIARVPVPIPFIGYYLSWFWWYILITIPCTMLFRKLLGVD